MKMTILNNGCSFSAKTKRPTVKVINGEKMLIHRPSYCDYLPDCVYNIAEHGSGIDVTRVNNFLNSNETKNINLTHFIWQIPSPTRQPLCKDYTIDDFFSAPIEIKQYIFKKYGKVPKRRHALHPGVFTDEVYDIDFLWAVLKFVHKKTGKRGKRPPIVMQEIHDIMDRRDLFYEKAIRAIKYNIDLIRSRFPEIKIMVLRYEETGLPFIAEFHKKFYKETVSEYCDINNIVYINENNFHTKWFHKHKLTYDRRHPNMEGAKLVANKIKEYL